MDEENQYRGPAVVRPVGPDHAAEVRVEVDLYWRAMLEWRARSGRLSGSVKLATDAGGSALPTGDVVLRLPDGYEVIGQVVVEEDAATSDWCGFIAATAAYVPAVSGGLDGHYLVRVLHPLGRRDRRSIEVVIEELISRVGCTATRVGPAWFCADLTDAQLDRMRHEWDVGYVAQEIEGHPAPCWRASPARAIEGQFLVLIRAGVGPLDVATRAGVTDAEAMTIVNCFFADLTEEQIVQLQHDSDVVELAEGSYTTLD